MPTNKTPFTFHLRDEYLEKLRYIAKQETRSVSNLLEHLCKVHIKNFEQAHGRIETAFLYIGAASKIKIRAYKKTGARG